MNTLTTLLLIPATIITLHSISYEITKHIKTKLYRNRHIEFEINKFTTQLGFTFSSNSLIIYFGGMSLCVSFNHHDPDSTSELVSYSLGFFSIDSEHIWRTFHFFNHSSELHWSTCSLISETTLDPSTHIFTTLPSRTKSITTNTTTPNLSNLSTGI